MAPRVARPCVVSWAVWAVMCYVVDDTRPRPRLAAMARAQWARAERRGVKISRPRTQCGDWPTRGPAKARHRAGPRGATDAATGRPASGRSRLARNAGHRRRRREAAWTAREWPLRQARAQQGPRGSQRDPWGRSLDRGRARRPGPRATDAEGTDRRNVAARPRSRRGAQPRRVGRGRARRPGGWGPWPALSGHGWDPPPKGHAWPPTSRADAQRAAARRAAALGAGATASGDPERAIRRPQAPNRAGAGPAPGWGPRTPRAKRWAAWWPNADPMVRAVLTRNGRRRGPPPQKKIASPTAQGTQSSNIRPRSSDPGSRR